MVIKDKKNNTSKDEFTSINKRLDAILRIMIETSIDKKQKKFNETLAAQAMYSVGMTPGEISKILGKKDGTSVAPMLYRDKSKKKPNKNKEKVVSKDD